MIHLFSTGGSKNSKDGYYIPYPSLDDKLFYDKIYHKKEFFDTKPPPLADPSDQSLETLSKIFRRDGDFRLLPQQRFLRNYISEATPYNGILVYHSVGSGKTCAAISIAERFRNRVDDNGKRILIVVGRNIRDEFLKTIFNFDKDATKTSTRQVVQCTGRTYQLGQESRHMSEKQKRKAIEKTIKSYYEIVGHGQLVNQAKRVANWDGKEESVTPQIQKRLSEHYSDRVIIVDEVHNRIGTEDQDDSTPMVLKVIVGSCKNLHIVLMSATPMVNTPKDILFSINLLRLNDKRSLLDPKKIFKKDGTLQPDGAELLREGAKGYISYVRGGDPPRFPYKLTPPDAKIPSPTYLISGEKIPEKEKIKHTRLILCEASTFHFDTYQSILIEEEETDVGGLFLSATQACNIVFPSTTDLGLYGSEGYGSKQSDDHPLIESKDDKNNIVYSYAPFANGFLLEKNIGKFSTKFKEIYQRIVKSQGIAYVYSEYLKGGVVALALMLEENGFIPARVTGTEVPLLKSKTKIPTICYKCGKPMHPPKEDHTWSPARYILFTGNQELRRSESAKISGYLNRQENMYGKLCKVLLGSKISGEGIDFKRIRQIHIMEPWFNQARIEQVEGRGIRNGSHVDLPPEQRNVEIFKYCMVPPKNLKGKIAKIETVDERNYRMAEDKDIKIKAVTRVLKESAVDCVFQRLNNIRDIHRTIRLEDSLGRTITYVTGDKPGSPECDYMKDCNYKCVWTPPKKDPELDKSTYGPEFAESDVDRARERIQELFKEHIAVDLKGIIQFIGKKESDVDKIYIFLALESLMDPEGDYAVQDRFGREGYLIEREDLYIFQPFNVEDVMAPVYYRKTPLTTKPLDVPFPVTSMEELEKETGKRQGVVDKKGSEIFDEIQKKYKKMKSVITMYTGTRNTNYDEIILSMTVDTMPDKWIVTLLRHLLSPLYDEKMDKSDKIFRDQLIKYYTQRGNVLIQKVKSEERRAVMIGSYCYQWGRAVHGLKRKERKEWGKCDPDVETYLEDAIQDYLQKQLWMKIPGSKKPHSDDIVTRSLFLQIAKEANVLSDYVGTVETTQKDLTSKKFFKVLDFTREESIQRKDQGRSRRSEIRGRVCATFNNKYLKDLLKKLEEKIKKKPLTGIKIPDSFRTKTARFAVCTRLEFLLRALNEKREKIWFYYPSFEEEIE